MINAKDHTPEQLELLYDSVAIHELSSGALTSVHIRKIKRLEKQLKQVEKRLEQITNYINNAPIGR